jgi:5-methylcytosine-specific restriction protein A
MREFSIDRRGIDEARKVKYWGLSGEDNPMYGVRGEANHNWKGGTTPERQSVYSSKEWVNAVIEVWKRDEAICQRCEMKKNKNNLFHIHHIASFSDYPDLRTEVSNLVLLCAPCHYFVHSKENTNKEFIK